MAEVKIGALCWNQYTDWPSLLEAGVRADRLGYTSLWTWDHLYPIVGNHEGPMFEAWLTLAAWAQATNDIRVGLMVGANTFREPALTAKMATTLDHISNGRAILGIGGAWFETEHEAFGIPFGDGFPERLRWLGEALPIMRGMLHGERPTATGPRYAAKEVRNDPLPIQERLPLLIGGGGEQVTLKLVAKYGDANNVGGGHREREAQGRDPRPALRDGRARPVGDRANDRHRHGRHPRLARGGRAGPARDRPAQRRRRGLEGPAGRDPGGRRREAGAVPRRSAIATSSPDSRRRTTRNR